MYTSPGTRPGRKQQTRTADLEFVIDGGGSTITTGTKGALYVDFACAIQQVTLLADQSGSIVVDIWVGPFSGYPQSVTQTITASDLPTLSSAQAYQDSKLTGWLTNVPAGSAITFHVNSITTCQRVTVALKVAKL